MKIINERVLLFLIINILLVSQKNFYVENFSIWNDKKRTYNKRINNVIIYFLNNSNIKRFSSMVVMNRVKENLSVPLN